MQSLLHTRRSFLGTAALAASASRPEHPNILVLLSDQLNASVLGTYGGPVPTSNLDRLARSGVVFTGATCPTPFCSPSRASLITGRWPHAHGITYNLMRKDYPAAGGREGEEGIRGSDVTLESLLHARGYSTHQYGKWHLSGDSLAYLPDQYGEHIEYAREMAEVFENIRSRPRETWMNWYGWALPVAVNAAYRRSFAARTGIPKQLAEFVEKIGRLELPLKQMFDVRVADRAIERLRAVGTDPFSITCSFNTPHDPNVVPSPYYERFGPARIELPANFNHREARFESEWSRRMLNGPDAVRAREFLRVYYGCIRLLDDQVGRVLDQLQASGAGDDTIIVFTADHGDMAGGHGMAWKSNSSFYDGIMRVPLIVSYARHVKPARTDAAVSLTDIAPSLLELCGIAIPRTMQGVSFAPLLRGGSGVSAYTFSERVAPNPQYERQVLPGTRAAVAIRGRGWKYNRYPDGGEYLYQLAKDPGEIRNLADEPEFASEKRELRHQLRLWLERTEYPGGPGAVVPK